MNLFEQIGKFELDSLISGDKQNCLVRGISLAPGQGVLKRGTLLARNEDDLGVILGESVELDDTGGASQTDGKEVGDTRETSADTVAVTIVVPSGILTDDVDTGGDTAGDPVNAEEYITGIFNPDAVIAKEGTEIRDFTEQLRSLGIFFEEVM